MKRKLRAKGIVRVGGQAVPATSHVQGIAGSIDDVTLYGRGFRETVTSRVLERPKISRTMEGASAITIPLHDPKGELRRSALMTDPGRVDVELDGLWFSLTDKDRQDDVLTLTFRDREVVALADKTGPKKAKNNKVTAPQFARALAVEAGVPFFCPELNAPTPVQTAKAGRSNELAKRVKREPGFGPNPAITVKHARASASQVRVIERVLDTGQSLKADRRAQIAAVMCITQESTAGAESPNVFQQNPDWPGNPNDIHNATRNFLVRATTYPGGLIKYLQKHPRAALGPAIQVIQRAGAGELYSQWESEATRTVDKYLGGTQATSQQTAAPKKQKPLARGPKENSWKCQGRLAEDLDWRRYVSAGVEYFISEIATLNSMPRMEIGDGTPGVERIGWKQSYGRPVTEVTVEAFAKTWQAPPGTVVDLTDQGPADGRYIVATIDTDLVKRNSLAAIKLKAPAAPNPREQASASASKKRKKRAPERDRRGDAEKFVRWLNGEVGVREGSSRHRQYAGSLGYSTSLPWCSIFVGYGLKTVCGLALPSNPAYSGAWIGWRGGRRVSASQIEPGDLVVFDWGDGGITDHVAAFVGNGKVIGGNQSNAVTKVSWNRGATVAVIRPDWRR